MDFEAIICSQRESSPVLEIPNGWHFFLPTPPHPGRILRNYQDYRVQTYKLEAQNLYNMTYFPRKFQLQGLHINPDSDININFNIKVFESRLSHRTIEVYSH